MIETIQKEQIQARSIGAFPETQKWMTGTDEDTNSSSHPPSYL